MNAADISRFLLSVSVVGRGVFGRRMTPTDWQILIVLGVARGAAGQFSVESLSPNAQSYKSLKLASGLSDDALSRGLRRLVQLELVARHATEADQRVIRYALTPRAEEGLAKIGRSVMHELGSLVLSMGGLTQQTGPLGKSSGSR